ncbi:MFS transporter [Corynebacterium qintianiae]|uniref:MFS transporter n=1 Tax=Corynebacterium qintianiae TaxID=2709392 RepID=A0A7T0KLW7_9CORY|nr:MFS transporter [Corynebacterium qintianiae]QPK82734.1 MFS transporter [Corynebacterium qintianiae]
MTTPHPRDRVTRRAIGVWLAAVAVYVVAITGRTSFGVAGLDAMGRFDVDATRIAVFTSVQVGVYALAQIPVGLLIDRLGPRFMLVAGALVMASGQALLGFTESYPLAIGARVLIGAGDATAFLSALRLLPYWFPLKRTPLFTQLTASIGQVGQFLSAFPFMALLHAQGWTAAFVTLAAVGALVGIAAFVAVADSPDEAPAKGEGARMPVGKILTSVLRSPLCWEAFTIHGLGMFFAINFTLLWGIPLMVQGMGLTPAQGATVLTVFTLSTMIGGPLLAPLSARTGPNRDVAAAVIAAAHCAAWVWFFASGEPRGFAAILALVVVMGAATPVSNFGFDTVREKMPRNIVASGTGLGNMGGFTSCMLSAQLIGMILDSVAPAGNYTWGDFRVAWIAVFAIWGALLAGMFTARAFVKR